MRDLKVFYHCALAALVVAGFSAPVRAEDCYADWGQAGVVVRTQKLVTVQQLSQPGVAAVKGDIVKSTLCKDGDDYVYKLVVRDSGGQLKTVVVDARNPGAAAAPATEGVQSLRSRP